MCPKTGVRPPEGWLLVETNLRELPLAKFSVLLVLGREKYDLWKAASNMISFKSTTYYGHVASARGRSARRLN